MRFPRFTIRQLMLAIVLVAVLTWCGRVGAAWKSYRDTARFHAASKAAIDKDLAPYLRIQQEYGGGFCGITARWMAAASDRAEWHRAMNEKYQRAAGRPWRPVEPDPPAPAYEPGVQ